MKRLRHVAIVAAALLLCLVLPGLFYAHRCGLLTGGADAVSSASLEVPDQPSGEYVILLNRERHPLTLEQWSDFFSEKPVDVIMEDLRCMTVSGDVLGRQLAERYRARLAENQLRLRAENGVLVVSRAENGLFDAIILSRETAEAFDYSAVYARPDVAVLRVTGGENP